MAHFQDQTPQQQYDAFTGRPLAARPAPTVAQHPTSVPPDAPAGAEPPAATAPALRQPRWSGKKTAVVAALAIGLSSAGAVAGAAALPAGSGNGSQLGRGGFSPGGVNGFGGPNGTTHQQPPS